MLIPAHPELGYRWLNRSLADDQITALAAIAATTYEGFLQKSLLSAKMMKEMKGVCFLFAETGTEGGWWAMQEDGFVAEDGHWKYEGLRFLEEGDDFTIYGDDGSELFHGMIHRDTRTGAIPRQVLRYGKLENHPTWKQQAVGGMWVHWIQEGIDPEVWGQLFIGNKRCRVRRKEENEDRTT